LLVAHLGAIQARRDGTTARGASRVAGIAAHPRGGEARGLGA
jgi:hypothetical protein